MQLRALQIPAVFVVFAVAASVSGAACKQPEDAFDDFVDRVADVDQGGASVSVSTGLIEGCVPPAPDSAVAGTYIFALSAQLKNDRPIFFKADVTFGDPASPSISIALTPLGTPYRDSGAAPFSELPPALEVGPFPLDAEGKFTAEFPPLKVDGKANPFSPNDLEATVKLDSGQVCEVNEGQPPANICGTFSGKVTAPLKLDLVSEKNFYAIAKYDGAIPNDPTAIVYDCAGTFSDAP